MADYTITPSETYTLLEIAGRIEPNNWQEMNETFTKLCDSPDVKNILVDLANLDYTASAGFRELFMAGKKLARKGGRLAVCSLQGEVKRVVELAGFATAYPIFDSRADAEPYFAT